MKKATWAADVTTANGVLYKKRRRWRVNWGFLRVVAAERVARDGKERPDHPAVGDRAPGVAGSGHVGVGAVVGDDGLGFGEVVAGILQFGGCGALVGEYCGGVVAGGQRESQGAVVIFAGGDRVVGCPRAPWPANGWRSAASAARCGCAGRWSVLRWWPGRVGPGR